MRTIAAAVLGLLVLGVGVVIVLRDPAPERPRTPSAEGPKALEPVLRPVEERRGVEPLRSTSESKRAGRAQSAVPAAKAVSPITRDARDGVGFAGRVRSTEGTAVAGANVVLTLAAGASGETRNLSRRPTKQASATTDRDGRFSFTRLPPASGRLDISARGHRAHQQAISIPRAGWHGAVFTLTPALQIRGRIVDRGRQPIPRAVVNAAGLPTSRSSGGAIAGTDGGFVIDGLAAGAHRLTARARGFVSFTRQAVPAGGDPVEIVLVRMGAVSGRVTSAGTGAPVESFRIHFGRVTAAGEAHWSRDAVGRPDGRYRVELAAGVYVGTFEADDLPTVRIERILVTAGEETTGVEFAIGRGGEVLGHATAVGAFAVEGTIRAVRLRSDGKVDARWRTRMTAIGEGGRFKLRGLAPGTWRLTLSSASCYADPIAPIQIAERQTLRVSVPVRRGGSLDVRVTTPTGARPASGTWRVTDARGRRWSGDFAAEPRVAVPLPVAPPTRGGFAIEAAIAPGAARVEIHVSPFASVRRKVTIRDGATARLDVRLR